MTEAEFRERAVVIYRSGPSEDSRKELHDLLDEAKQTYTIEQVALMAARALDNAYPMAAAVLGSAEGRMTRRFSDLN